MSEEKTRIVPRSDATSEGGTITFHCDNGHRINVPAKLAGKRGTCSKCGIAVVIPVPAPARSTAPAETAPASEAAATPAPEEFPGPAPTMVEPAPVADAFAGLFAEQAAAEAPAPEEVVIDAEQPSGGSAVGDVVAGYAPEEFGAPDVGGAVENPTAQLVARLWLEQTHGGTVELHLVGGSVIRPQWYESRWSRGTHGLFANLEADDTVTLTAVAWDSIQKIIVRQVRGLPDGMFE